MDKRVTERGICNSHGGYERGYSSDASDGSDGSHDGCNFDCDWRESGPIKLSHFISLTSKSEKINLEFDPTKAINCADGSSDDEEFWGYDKVKGTCSGPTGNEGVSLERWYQRKVVVLWRADKSLSLKIRSCLSDGVSHVLALLKKGELDEGKQGFKLLWRSLRNVSSNPNDVIKFLEMSTILNFYKEACHLLKILFKWGIPNNDSACVVAHTACCFKDNEKIVVSVKELLKKSYKSQTKHVLQCCSSISWLNSTETLEIVMDYTLINTSSPRHRYYDSNTSNFKSVQTGCDTSIYSNILEFMNKHDTFPSGKIEKIVSMIDSVDEMDSALSSVSQFQDGHLKYHLFISQFLSIVSDELTNEKSDEATKVHHSISNIFDHLLKTYLVQSYLEQTLTKLVCSIRCLPKHSQSLIKILVGRIQVVFLEVNVPDFLLKACKSRLKHLGTIISRGEPDESWKQPTAVVPDHPKVQQFLRGPARTFTYRNFNDLNHAYNWSRKHRNDRGCSMNLTPSERGSSAIVDIVKIKQSYDGGKVAALRRDKEEYKRLLELVSAKRDDLNQQDKNKVNPKKAEVIVLD